MREDTYDYRNCSSLFGYSAAVHTRSGGVCQLCGAGAKEPDFDLWRQLTVEHLVGESQGGYPVRIRAAVALRFPDLSGDEQSALSATIDAANTITACSFCNSTTSRDRSDRSMTELIEAPTSGPEETYSAIKAYCTAVLERKRSDVAWKLESVRAAFESIVLPGLRETRGEPEGTIQPAAPSNFQQGRDFQELVGAALAREVGEAFDLEVDLPIGTPPKPHRFDLASRSRRIVCECKAYTWTESGNVPSAKITHLREAVTYLTQLPEQTTRILAVKHAAHATKSETLGEYFVRLNQTILGSTLVLEVGVDGGTNALHGDPEVLR